MKKVIVRFFWQVLAGEGSVVMFFSEKTAE